MGLCVGVWVGGLSDTKSMATIFCIAEATVIAHAMKTSSTLSSFSVGALFMHNVV